MKLYFIFCICGWSFSYSQEIRRISKAQGEINEKNQTYLNALPSSGNAMSKDVAYKGKDTALFIAELNNFLNKLNKELKSDDGSINFINEHKVMTYVLYISNTGYIDAFYYDFEDGKLKLPFIGTLNSFIANYKWENAPHDKFVHSSVFTFK